MSAPLASRGSLARHTVALGAAAALLASTLLAAGAHQHLSSSLSEAVCSIDHESRAGAGATSVEAAARAHRHHCASCQLAASGAAHQPAPAGFLKRPPARASHTVEVLGLEHGRACATASPRGPPRS